MGDAFGLCTYYDYVQHIWIDLLPLPAPYVHGQKGVQLSYGPNLHETRHKAIKGGSLLRGMFLGQASTSRRNIPFTQAYQSLLFSIISIFFIITT